MDLPVLHDHEEVRRICEQLQLLEGIAVDKENIGVGVLLDHAERTVGIWIQWACQLQQFSIDRGCLPQDLDVREILLPVGELLRDFRKARPEKVSSEGDLHAVLLRILDRCCDLRSCS